MAHGCDTDILVRMILEATDKLIIHNLNITSLPPLPKSLKYLDCKDTPLTELPVLPNSLKRLWCENTQITKLPILPDSLGILSCTDTPLTELPTLPPKLFWLDINTPHITILPEIPPSLQTLGYINCPNLVIKRQNIEFVRDYEQRWKPVREEMLYKPRIQARCAAIKEELMAAAWHPRRVEKWLEIGGFELLDAL